MALFSLRSVSLAFGGPRLLDQVSLQIERGERLCLMGRNGEGKSTLLRLIRGEIEADEGEFIRQQGLVVSMLPQQVPRERTGTVEEQVAKGLQDQGHEAHWVGSSGTGSRIAPGPGRSGAIRRPFFRDETACAPGRGSGHRA